MNSKPLQQLSTSIWPYLIADKKKLEKRVKIVPQQQQQQHPTKKQKISNTNGGKSKAVEKPSTSSKSKGSSIEEGKKMFEWLMTPVTIDDFMR